MVTGVCSKQTNLQVSRYFQNLKKRKKSQHVNIFKHPTLSQWGTHQPCINNRQALNNEWNRVNEKTLTSSNQYNKHASSYELTNNKKNKSESKRIHPLPQLKRFRSLHCWLNAPNPLTHPPTSSHELQPPNPPLYFLSLPMVLVGLIQTMPRP